ncbi:hypothetical protein N7520_010168 [Penicillium odoratum]|uniref:uncharacterized protein n=1 Tax=Penicillium odoratum TaxID=1167516 RepID=UPI0025499BFE|nr:uncharacterized protein N7520_010168 [Penicillium odoratum]KAJ5753251.1 hypothetical protein N7520_010168 [Penicillium odoratum]
MAEQAKTDSSPYTMMRHLTRASSPFERHGFIYVPRPLETDGLLHFKPSEGYARVISEINRLRFDDDHGYLVKSINRLCALHAADRGCRAYQTGFECPEDLVPKMAQVEQLLESEGLNKENDDHFRGIVDMCHFFHLAPLIKKDLDQLPDSAEKELLLRLYSEICPGGHIQRRPHA